MFLSTTLNLGCGGGYFGSQFHWNSSAMNLDWAVWDIVRHARSFPVMTPVPADASIWSVAV